MFLCQLLGKTENFLSLIINNPLSGFNKPEIISTSVDLPAPVLPLMPINSSFFSSKSKLFNTFFLYHHN